MHRDIREEMEEWLQPSHPMLAKIDVIGAQVARTLDGIDWAQQDENYRDDWRETIAAVLSASCNEGETPPPSAQDTSDRT